MNISINKISFGQFKPWRLVDSVNVSPLEREKLMDIKDSINAGNDMKNYDVEGFVYTTRAPEIHNRRKKIRLFIMPSLNYFKKIKMQKTDANINDYEKMSKSFYLNDKFLEEKIAEFLFIQRGYINMCAHHKDHGVLYRCQRPDIFNIDKTKPLL